MHDTFTPTELAYLAGQDLGRLATVDAAGTPQNSPVGFRVGDDGTVVIGGLALGSTRKFRNVRRHGRVSLVVDDLEPGVHWGARGVEVRGRAEALEDVDPDAPWMSREQIRIHPEHIISWGLENDPRSSSGAEHPLRSSSGAEPAERSRSVRSATRRATTTIDDAGVPA